MDIGHLAHNTANDIGSVFDSDERIFRGGGVLLRENAIFAT